MFVGNSSSQPDPPTPLPLQDWKAVNELRCLGNIGLCNQEAGLFLDERGEKKMTHCPSPPRCLPLVRMS